MAASGRMSGAVIALGLAVIGAGLIVYGLTTAAPLVDFATDEEAALEAAGVLRVRIGCGLTAAAGLVLMLSAPWWTGAVVVAGSVVLALVVGSSTPLSLLLGLGLVAFTLGVTLGHLVSAARR
jgi:hypothetical protein